MKTELYQIRMYFIQTHTHIYEIEMVSLHLKLIHYSFNIYTKITLHCYCDR